MQKLGDSIDVDEVDNGKDELGFPAWDPLAIREQSTPFLMDILFELSEAAGYSFEG